METETTSPPGVLRALGRGAVRRCPRCGRAGIFDGWFGIVDACPRCGLRFEHAEGYWLGAMMIDTAVTFGLFFAVLIGMLVVTWPDVPWTAVTVTVVALNLVVPIAFYPISQTLWVAIERSFRSWSER